MLSGAQPVRSAAQGAGGRGRGKGRPAAMRLRCVGLGLVLWLAGLAAAPAQRAYNWRVYKIADGLPTPECSAVSVDFHTNIYARHPRLDTATVLDGFSLRSLPLAAAGADRLYASPGGRQVWTTYPDGLREALGGEWLSFPVKEIAAELRSSNRDPAHPIPLCPVRQGRVLCLLPEQLLDLNAEATNAPRTLTVRAVGQTGLGRFLDLTIARDGGLLITGAKGVARVPGPARLIKPETRWEEALLPAGFGARNLSQPTEDAEGGITAIAETPDGKSRLIVHYDDREGWSLPPGLPAAAREQAQRAWRGPLGTWWATGGEGLFQWDPAGRQMIENEEVQARRYFDLALEPGGAFWLASSDGLFRYAPRTWRNLDAPEPVTFPVGGLAEDDAGRLWLAGTNALYAWRNDLWARYELPAPWAEDLRELRSLHPLANGDLWVETRGRVLQLGTARGDFQLLGSPVGAGGLRALGRYRDGRLAVQSSRPELAATSYHLALYDGVAFQPWPLPEPESGLGPELTVFCALQNGDLWLGGRGGLAWYHDRKWVMFRAATGDAPEGVLRLVELADGRFWCANRDQLWQFDGQGWTRLRSGFDQINSVVRFGDGAWLASNGGLYRYFQGAWVENGIDEGLPPAAVKQVYLDRHDRLWAATARGLSRFYPEADPDPPRTTIVPPAGRIENLEVGSPVTLTFTGQDKWKYTPRDRLLFSYRLDDKDWTIFQESNSVSLFDLGSGNHVFQVRAMDRNCNMDPRPARLEFALALPWYKESRLMFIAGTGVAAVLFFAGLAFNRHRRLVRSYAEVERQVAERTRQLERANQELLQSQKMTALGTLAAGIAHDFNNILSIIQGSAQIIEANLDNPDKIRTRLDRIKTVVEQGAGIVRAMLGFSRSSDREPGPCDLNLVVEDTVKLLGDRFLREVELDFARGAQLPPVPGPKDFIQQILLNILFNAAEASAARKHVVLATGQIATLPSGLALAPAAAPAYVFVTIRDFGCGITPENLPRIFEPFFTTKALSSRRGTGLGLSMVYELAKKMNAGLAVSSVVNEGTTFTLLLPVPAA